MNWTHLRAFVWLRWRLLYNQTRRAGAISAFLLVVVTVGAIVTSVPLLIGSFVAGTGLIPSATPAQLMYAWDAVLAGFLVFWGVGLMTELQRNDPFALSKFMHLPVSVRGAFLINYLSSLLRLSLIVFGPVMLGFGLALVSVKGASQIAVLPLIAAFLLMVTALTYQLQGWLGSLMADPRRRRAVIVGATMFIVLFAQLPALFNMFAPWGPRQRERKADHAAAEVEKLKAASARGDFDATELARRVEALTNAADRTRGDDAVETVQWLERTARVTNTVLPVGWLPLGVEAAAEGRFLPPVLGLAGMTLIGVLSLQRSYRMTMGQYQGELSNRKPKSATAPPATPKSAPGASMLEATLPWLSEPVAAIALGGFRSLLRAPEAKMALMTPLITCTVFGSMVFNGRAATPELLRPMLAIGGILCVFLGALQLTANQFGFDRDGFRVFVLSAARRGDILFGKNLAFAPVTLGMSLTLLVVVQVFCPLRWDHFLAMFPLGLGMFLLFCLFTNLCSIYAPVYVPPGSLKTSNPRLKVALLQIIMFLFLFPLSQLPAVVPLGVEALSKLLGWTDRAPIFLLLSIAECAAIALLYRLALGMEGDLLQSREQKILETVTNRAA